MTDNQGFRYWLAPSRIAAPHCLTSFEDAILFLWYTCGYFSMKSFSTYLKTGYYRNEALRLKFFKLYNNFILIGRSPESYLVLYCIHTFLTNS